MISQSPVPQKCLQLGSPGTIQGENRYSSFTIARTWLLWQPGAMTITDDIKLTLLGVGRHPKLSKEHGLATRETAPLQFSQTFFTSSSKVFSLSKVAYLLNLEWWVGRAQTSWSVRWKKSVVKLSSSNCCFKLDTKYQQEKNINWTLGSNTGPKPKVGAFSCWAGLGIQVIYKSNFVGDVQRDRGIHNE